MASLVIEHEEQVQVSPGVEALEAIQLDANAAQRGSRQRRLYFAPQQALRQAVIIDEGEKVRRRLGAFLPRGLHHLLVQVHMSHADASAVSRPDDGRARHCTVMRRLPFAPGGMRDDLLVADDRGPEWVLEVISHERLGDTPSEFEIQGAFGCEIHRMHARTKLAQHGDDAA